MIKSWSQAGHLVQFQKSLKKTAGSRSLPTSDFLGPANWLVLLGIVGDQWNVLHSRSPLEVSRVCAIVAVPSVIDDGQALLVVVFVKKSSHLTEQACFPAIGWDLIIVGLILKFLAQ